MRLDWSSVRAAVRFLFISFHKDARSNKNQIVLSVSTSTTLNKLKNPAKLGTVHLKKLRIQFFERQYYYLKNFKYMIEQKFS